MCISDANYGDIMFQSARVVSFVETVGESYIAMPGINVDANFQMTFKMKSQNEDGLLFYVSDDQQSQVSFIYSFMSHFCGSGLTAI